MKKLTILFFALLMIGRVMLSAQESFIQVVAEPNISVFIDGIFKGTTISEMGGLVIDNLVGGTYSIKVVKEGFTPQEESITIKNGEVRQYEVQPFIPEVTIRQQGNENQQTIERKTGNLKIQSIPVEIKIKIKALGINSNKEQDEWYADSVNIGSYDAIFTWNDKELLFEIPIIERKQTSLLVNMFSSEVEFRGETAEELNRQIKENEIRKQEDEDSQQNASRMYTSGELAKDGEEESESRFGEFVDSRDQRVYKTTELENQTWMAEDLKYKIPDRNRGHWGGTGYGHFYYWYEALEVCPNGWHLPSDEEWKELEIYLGMSASEANKTKERGSDEGNKLKAYGWEGEDYNRLGSEFGFKARSSGYFAQNMNIGDPEYDYYRTRTRFWTSTRVDNKVIRNAWYRELRSNSGQIWRRFSKCGDFSAYSVRCVKD